jgi:dolichol-phosphate mannosyltransferase
VYNEEECIDELVRRLLLLRENLCDGEVGIIFVNDGSRDGSLAKLYGYAERFHFLRVINLSRNYGHQFAVTAGLDHVRSDYAAIIDADLQDPPELIAEMLKKAKEGFGIVYGKRISRKGETYTKKLTAKLFYRFISRMCDVGIPEDTGDFRLISRQVIEAVQTMRERHRFLRGMVPWVGYSSYPFLYNRDERYAGVTKYPMKKMIRFALDAIFSFSNAPLRLATYSGLTIVALGVLGGLFLLYLRFFTMYSVPGITAAILTVILIGGVQIIMLGIIGEYIGRIFEEVKHRPLYLVENMKNMPDAMRMSGKDV